MSFCIALSPKLSEGLENGATFCLNSLRGPATGSLLSCPSRAQDRLKAGFRPQVLGARVVFRVFFLFNFPSFSQLTFFRKEATKKNRLHFQFPPPLFPHGYDVEGSFRNAQVTHAGTPRGGTQEFLRAGGGRRRAPPGGRPQATRGSRDWKVPRKSPVAGEGGLQLKGKKRELPSLQPAEPEAERRAAGDVHTSGQTASPSGRPWGSASDRPPPRPGARPSAAARAHIDGSARPRQVSGARAAGFAASRMRAARPALGGPPRSGSAGVLEGGFCRPELSTRCQVCR